MGNGFKVSDFCLKCHLLNVQNYHVNVYTHSILHLVASAKLGFIILDRDKGLPFLSIQKPVGMCSWPQL